MKTPLTRPVPANHIPAREGSGYPAPFAASMAGRSKRKLGEAFGLDRFGINLTELAPGACSALPHHHQRQDEFIYILEGEATLVLGEQRLPMRAGDCMGFPRGQGIAHQLCNEGNRPVRYLELGDRTPNDRVEYPGHDLLAISDDQGRWRFYRADGSPAS